MIDQRGSRSKKEKRDSVSEKEMITLIYLVRGSYKKRNSEGVIRSWKLLMEGIILNTRFLFGIVLLF